MPAWPAALCPNYREEAYALLRRGRHPRPEGAGVEEAVETLRRAAAVNATPDFSSDTDFMVDLTYELTSFSTGDVLPYLRFDIQLLGNSNPLYTYQHALNGGQAGTSRLAAGDYRLRIRNDVIVGVSAGGSTTRASEGISGNVGFSISQVAGVPEPATWALMILGFGLVGITVRRRRATALI